MYKINIMSNKKSGSFPSTIHDRLIQIKYQIDILKEKQQTILETFFATLPGKDKKFKVDIENNSYEKISVKNK